MEQTEACLKILTFSVRYESSQQLVSGHFSVKQDSEAQDSVSKKQTQHKHSMPSTTLAMSEAKTPNLLTNLSPYTLCLLRLGLAFGVRSLTRAASSIPLRALLKAAGSTGSDPALSMPSVVCPLTRFRLLIAIGGVSVSEGEIKVGVCEVSTVLEVTEDVMCDSIVVSRIAAICRFGIVEGFQSRGAPGCGPCVMSLPANSALVNGRWISFAV